MAGFRRTDQPAARWMMAGAAFLVSALPALAACPTPADLGNGIRITYDDGETEVFRRHGAMTVETRYKDTDAEFRDVLGHGLYLLSTKPVVPGDPADDMTVDFGRPLADLPTPMAGMTATLDVLESFGSDTAPVREIYTSSAMRDVVIAGCPLRAFDVKLTRDDGVSVQVERVRYLADFGFGYVTGVGDAGAPLETFSLTGFERAE